MYHVFDCVSCSLALSLSLLFISLTVCVDVCGENEEELWIVYYQSGSILDNGII
jgi:hypothetical protein